MVGIDEDDDLLMNQRWFYETAFLDLSVTKLGSLYLRQMNPMFVFVASVRKRFTFAMMMRA